MIVLDTSVLIAHLRGDERATRFLLDIPTADRVASVLARIEVEGGMRSDERRPVASLFGVIRLLPVTDQIARRAGELLRAYRRSHTGIDLVDYAVAATAELHGARLATLNIKDFPMFPDLAPPY
jgi:predicted nucleic acid-binding protein